MFCEKCGKQLGKEANFCNHCGAKVSAGPQSITVKTGDSSINIGVGNLPNSTITIGDTIVKENEPLVYEMNKTSNYRLPIKASWVTFVGVIGFLGSIASIYSVLSNDIFNSNGSDTWMFLLLPIAMLLIYSSMILLKSKFIWLQFFGLSLDEKGYVHFINLKGKCPLCTGSLSVRYTGPKGAQSLNALCSRNPEQHLFHFDPTWLDNL